MAANFIHGAAIKFHCRLFLIPWVKRNSSISYCAQARNCISSLPVKCEPKKSVKSDEKEDASLPVKYTLSNSLKSEEKEVNSLSVKDCGERNNVPARIDVPGSSSSIFCDFESNSHDVFCSPTTSNGINLDVKEEINEDLVTREEEFTEKPELKVEDNGKRFRGVQSPRSRQDIEKLAIGLLASRAFTALELKKKLQGKKCPADIVDAVVIDFQSRGMINDCLYAETYSQSRWSSSTWGPRRIKHELFKKGVQETDVNKAIKQTFESDEEGDGRDAGIAMSKLSMDQLYCKAAKQWQQSHSVPHETRKSRIVRWLQYRGFSWSVVKHVLKKLESEQP